MINDVPALIQIAGLRPPHKHSLAYLLSRTLQKKSEATGPAQLWTRAGGYGYQSWEPVFTALEQATHPGIDDASVIQTIYGSRSDWDWAGLFGGATTHGPAKDAFTEMRRRALYLFMQPLAVRTLDAQSYPYTYLNTDVAKLFSATAAAKDPDLVGGRVQATAQIMFRILYGNTLYRQGHFFETRTLFSAFTLGHLHQVQLLRAPFKEGSHYYFNQGALAWTLLTFAYFIGRAWKEQASKGGVRGQAYASSDFEEGQWYRFWGLLGSCMGIANELLPRTHDEAAALYELFRAAKLANTERLTPDNQEIYDVYGRKRTPTSGEFKKLLEWVPTYFGSQWTHPLAWGAYGASLGWSAISWLARTVKKNTIG